MTYSFGHVARLFRIELTGLSFADRAKAAMTRANVAAQHESRGAIGPAFENVRTTRFLANRVQVKSFDQLQHVVLIRRIAQTNLQPFGLGLTELLIVADYTEFAGQLIYLCKDFTCFGVHRRETGRESTRINTMGYKLSSPRKETLMKTLLFACCSLFSVTAAAMPT